MCVCVGIPNADKLWTGLDCGRDAVVVPGT